MSTGNQYAEEKVSRRKSLLQRLSFLALSVFALTIFAGEAHAQIVGDLDANIPFPFEVGNKTFPAGNYRIHVLDDATLATMEISSMDGRTSALFEVYESDAKSTPAQSELTFNKYGDHYFLAKVFDEGNPSGSELIKSRDEKQISRTTTVAQEQLPAHHKMQQGD
jgi:hypothetical protein